MAPPKRFPLSPPAPGLILLLLPAMIALAVRVYRLDLPVLTADEAFSWRLIHYPASQLCQRTAADVHPPAFYLLLQALVSLWGDTPGALRGFAVFWGMAAIPLLYLLCRESASLRDNRADGPSNRAGGGALFAAFLMATHLAQVAPSRTARMYSLGVFLTCLTGWLLLRSLRVRKGSEWWWSAYGLAVAVFCYVHYYAFFTILAQIAFVAALLLCRAWRHSWQDALAPASGFAFAGTLTLILYLPWFPSLWAQTQEVHQGFWISALTPEAALEAFCNWSAGMSCPGRGEIDGWLTFLAAAILWMAVRGGWPAWFFLLQVALPWVLSVSLSVFSGRSVFVERYLVFAQVALLGFWGVAWSRLPGTVARLVLGGFVAAPCLYGLATTLHQLPDKPPAIQEAAEYLHVSSQPGDVVFVDHPAEFNRLLYYTTRFGECPPSIRCVVNPFQPAGHVTHIAALRPEDTVWLDGETSIDSLRCWKAYESVPSYIPLPNMKPASTHVFHGGGSEYNLLLFVREK